MRTVAPVVLLAFVAHAHATTTDDVEQASAIAYVGSLFMPRMADLCSKDLPGYRERFEAAFPVWQLAWKTYIDKGRSWMEEGARKEGIGPDAVNQFLESQWRTQLNGFQALSKDKLAARCSDWLEGLKATPPQISNP